MRERLNSLYPFSSLLIGLILTQMLATVHVYLSNTVLYESLLVIKSAGYLTVPNSRIMDQLLKATPAFWGGAFFYIQYRRRNFLFLISPGMDLGSNLIPQDISSLRFSITVGDLPGSY